MALSSKVAKALAKLSKQDKNGLFSSEIAALETALDGVADKEALKQVKAESKAVKAGNKYYSSALKASSSDKAYAEAKADEAKAATETGNKAEIKNIKANIKAVKAAEKAAAKAGLNAADTKEFVDAVKANADAANAKDIKAITKQVSKKQLDADQAADKIEDIGNDDNGGNGNGGGNVTPGKPGETFMLTKGLDNYVGTDKDDTIIGSIDTTAGSEMNTWSPIDQIDGGKGRDTLKILGVTAVTANDFSSVSNVEVVEVSGVDAVTVDTTTGQGIEELNIVGAGAGKAVSATAAATTDINVDMKAVDAGTTINGGKDVTVKLTDVIDVTTGMAKDKITIGGTSGDVVVEATAKAAVNGTNVTMGTITVAGGKTISVTQKAGDASGLVAGGTATTHAQGAVIANADATTTDITVKQDATKAGGSVKGVAKVDEVATVTFSKLDATQSVTVGGLIFTASKNLTAEEVAQAFANLTADAIQLATPNKGDTQGSGVHVNGVFTGELVGVTGTNKFWSSSAATGNTVTFTGNGAMADLTVGGTGGSVVTTTQGVDFVAESNSLGINSADVTITGGAALKNVTVDGYTSAGTTAGTHGIKGTTNTALENINLSNGNGFVVESAAATLALKATNVNGTVDVVAGTTTLNAEISNTGLTSTALKSASVKALNVTGSGKVSGSNTDLTVVEAINTSGLTAGTATFTIDGEKTTYTGGAAVDLVTIASGKKVEKDINLGAGNDTLDLSKATIANAAAVTGKLDGGAGDADTLVLSQAQADKTAGLSNNTDFRGKHTGFERLAIDTANSAINVDLEALGFASYVIAKGTTANTAGLTLENLAANATVEFNNASKITASLKNSDGTADNLNVALNSGAALAATTELIANKVETFKITATDAGLVAGAVAKVHALKLSGDEVTSVTVDGNAGLDLTLTSTDKLATINASANTGGINVAATGKVAMTITGGAGADVIKASVGATAKADIINGGAGNDIIYSGSNSAILTGGAGNDLFILQAGAGKGTLDGNTYNEITDFKVGNNVLQLENAKTFTKLNAVLNESTAQLSDYVAKAMEEMADGAKVESIYFNFKGDTYIVLEGVASSATTFTDGTDAVIKLTGINGDNLSFNADHGSVALI